MNLTVTMRRQLDKVFESLEIDSECENENNIGALEWKGLSSESKQNG